MEVRWLFTKELCTKELCQSQVRLHDGWLGSMSNLSWDFCVMIFSNSQTTFSNIFQVLKALCT